LESTVPEDVESTGTEDEQSGLPATAATCRVYAGEGIDGVDDEEARASFAAVDSRA